MIKKIERFLKWVDPDYQEMARHTQILIIDQQIKEHEKAINELRKKRYPLLDQPICKIRSEGW